MAPCGSEIRASRDQEQGTWGALNGLWPGPEHPAVEWGQAGRQCNARAQCWSLAEPSSCPPAACQPPKGAAPLNIGSSSRQASSRPMAVAGCQRAGAAQQNQSSCSNKMPCARVLHFQFCAG